YFPMVDYSLPKMKVICVSFRIMASLAKRLVAFQKWMHVDKADFLELRSILILLLTEWYTGYFPNLLPEETIPRLPKDVWQMTKNLLRVRKSFTKPSQLMMGDNITVGVSSLIETVTYSWVPANAPI